MSQEKRNIQPLIEKEEPHLHNILPSEDVKAFKNMVGELRDTWTKKQIFRTETEARISVLQDMKYPTKAEAQAIVDAEVQAAQAAWDLLSDEEKAIRDRPTNITLVD